jgi:23S rRNA (adenine2503-C2)-methyltransferase
MGETRTDLKGMTLAELEALFSRRGKERYRARQIFRWLYRKHAADFAAMTDLSRDFREELSRECRISSLCFERVTVSSDGTEKSLFRLEDGDAVESVLIPEDGRRTVCVSSQAGCALGCAFCATGAEGFRRNLSSGEIIHQVCHVAKLLGERGERLTNVVFMGMGEPLENRDAVARSIGILLSPFGFALSGKRVTVSTSGLVPEMTALARDLPVSIAVSINAPTDDLRSRLMPVNRRYPLKELVAAMKAIPLRSGRKVTAEYVLLGGINDLPEDAEKLAGLLFGLRTKVNLIPYNPHGRGKFRPSDPSAAERFREILSGKGIQTIVRERRGADIRAACGQLSATAAEEKGLERGRRSP